MYMDEYLYGLNNVCVFTSLLFITNIIISYHYGNYIYVFLFSCLLTTSVIFHYTQNEVLRIIDKIFVYLIVIYGGYLVFNKSVCDCNSIEYFCIFVIIVTFLACAILYMSGIADIPFNFCGIYGKHCHGLIHFCASLGHNLIAIL